MTGGVFEINTGLSLEGRLRFEGGSGELVEREIVEWLPGGCYAFALGA